MDGYSVQEAASVLGIAEGRVWELLARGVISGTPDGDSMRVFLRAQAGPIATAGARDEPPRTNGNGGSHAQGGEASAFRELLTEFRNLTERYGQALLALGEARGEVAGLRSRVDLLEARLDLRVAAPMEGSTIAWEAPVTEPAPASEPAAAVFAAPAPPSRKSTARKRRSTRDAMAGFADALARAQDPGVAAVADAPAAEGEEEAPSAIATAAPVTQDEPIAEASAAVEAEPEAPTAEPEPPEAAPSAAEAVEPVTAEVEAPEAAEAASAEAPAPEPAEIEAPSYSSLVVEPDWFADGDFAWLDAAEIEARGQQEAVAEPETAPEPEPVEAVVEAVVEPEPEVFVELEALAEPERMQAELETVEATPEAVVEPELEAVEAAPEAVVEPELEAVEAELEALAEPEPVQAEPVEAEPEAAEAVEAVAESEPVAEVEPEAFAEPEPVQAEPVEAELEAAEAVEALAEAEPVIAASIFEPLPAPEVPYESQPEFEPWRQVEPEVEPPSAAPETTSAPDRPPPTTATAVGEIDSFVEEEVMWLGAETTPTPPPAAPAPEPETWLGVDRVQPVATPVVETVRPPLAMTEDELTRLALDEGWDEAEVAAIRAMITPPPRLAVDLPGGSELDEAMAALDAVPVQPDGYRGSASRQWVKPAAEENQPQTPDPWAFEAEPPAPFQPWSEPPIAADQDATPGGTPTEPGWLGRRQGTAASAYRRLRRLFPG